MSVPIWKIVRVARRIAKSSPLLGYDLERFAVGVMNPGVQTFEQNLENTVSVLRSLEEELQKALDELDTADAAEFAKFFSDATEAETHELQRMLKKVSTTAGVKDFFKGLFKKGPKKPKDDGSSGMEPFYQMDDAAVDAFVDGSGEWSAPSQYIEQEAAKNQQFFDGVSKVLKDVAKARKTPSRSLIDGLLSEVRRLIQFGDKLVQGLKKAIPKKSPPPKPGSPSKGSKIAPEKLESTVTHYADALKQSVGDEKKTISLLKELFDSVGPALQEERASISSSIRSFASVLVRIAHANPELRPGLIPVILRATKAAEKPKQKPKHKCCPSCTKEEKADPDPDADYSCDKPDPYGDGSSRESDWR
ncbi:MAG: hypothetical protein BWY99_01831 [Synergistetes bacterium ADurb.BinA166]|nr:MAG: hypothetical protein BWY99_01831 [Synergistetes bacterium ADurb.BinA166]